MAGFAAVIGAGIVCGITEIPILGAVLILYAAHKPIFVIDAYTKRICECIGVTGGYEILQRHFEDSLPLDTHLYQEFHALIVAYGKAYCTRKRCDECIIARV